MLTIEQQLMLAKKSYDGIVAQGGPATSNDDVCQYRTREGSKCGIGQLIADNVYEEVFEGQSARSTKIMEAIEKSQTVVMDKTFGTPKDPFAGGPKVISKDSEFLVELQRVHDDAAASAASTNEAFLTAFKTSFNALKKSIKEGRFV